MAKYLVTFETGVPIEEVGGNNDTLHELLCTTIYEENKHAQRLLQGCVVDIVDYSPIEQQLVLDSLSSRIRTYRDALKQDLLLDAERVVMQSELEGLIGITEKMIGD